MSKKSINVIFDLSEDRIQYSMIQQMCYCSLTTAHSIRVRANRSMCAFHVLSVILPLIFETFQKRYNQMPSANMLFSAMMVLRSIQMSKTKSKAFSWKVSLASGFHYVKFRNFTLNQHSVDVEHMHETTTKKYYKPTATHHLHYEIMIEIFWNFVLPVNHLFEQIIWDSVQCSYFSVVFFYSIKCRISLTPLYRSIDWNFKSYFNHKLGMRFQDRNNQTIGQNHQHE